jgi:hypothetical protein
VTQPTPPRSSLLSVAGGLATGGSLPALALAGAPWWAIVPVAVLVAITGLVLAAAHAILPQESRDRATILRDLLKYHAERQPKQLRGRRSRP